MTGAPFQTQFTGNPFGQQTQNNPLFSGTPNTTPQIMQTSSSSPSAVSNMTDNSHYSKLNNMLQNRDDGMDTFGNTGNLRIPFGTGFASTLLPQQQTSHDTSSFSQSFGQQVSRNPFGQANVNTNTNTTETSRQGQKSLLEMMQEQKLLQAQMTGYQQQPSMTGYQQPQMTGIQQGLTSSSPFNQPRQQQPPSTS
ncbi:uncharacterized protein BX663DRAFT_524257, partial [Cokeromyces recurvatus]|uniref:uncharacterized protein n=1 Tax=Cokeromyces recurvatus TaxID=90255 RepID=UPI00221E5341